MITMSKIAKLAHVSVSTVSKAFSMSEDVHPETREAIFDIARQYGCFKKYYRAKYPKQVVAVICPELKSRYYNFALSMLQSHLAKYNCEICVASTDFSKKATRDLLHYYNHYTSVDGVILINTSVEIDPYMEIPVVAICSSAQCNSNVRVTVGYKDGLAEAVDYFLSKGVTQIGFVGETITQSKLRLFRNLLEERGVCPDDHLFSIVDERFEKGGYLAMEQLFASGHLPRALVCAYDHMAIGAIRCIYDHGLKVPEDIAVLGMDNIPECGYLNPPLSSIDSNLGTACRSAANAMMDCLLGNPVENTICVRPKLHLRKSTEI